MGVGASKVFRDPVHGDITFERDLEMQVIDTPEFQRLRGIKQLGTASLVYPGALHTRFEHGLGTSWLARRILDRIGETTGRPVEAEHRRIVSVAAVLHDVTHIPFGHTFEDERRIWDRHDCPERTRRFLGAGTLGRRLRALGLTKPVLEVLAGGGDPPFLREVISGTICADLLDYLARDATFLGVEARYDPRIFRAFSVDKGHLILEAQKDGIVRADTLSEVVNLLRLRYFLSERAYFHHAKTASGAMISKAVEGAVGKGLNLADLYDLRDEDLFHMLRAGYGHDPVVSGLVRRVLERRIHKRVYVLTRRVGPEFQRALVRDYHLDRGRREQAEADLSREMRLRPGELIIYCPSERMALKEADVPVRLDRGAPQVLSHLRMPEVDVLLDKHRDLWRFYVFVAPERQRSFVRIARACEAYFSAENQIAVLESGQFYLGLGR